MSNQTLNDTHTLVTSPFDALAGALEYEDFAEATNLLQTNPDKQADLDYFLLDWVQQAMPTRKIDDVKKIEFLVAQGADFNYRDINGASPREIIMGQLAYLQRILNVFTKTKLLE